MNINYATVKVTIENLAVYSLEGNVSFYPSPKFIGNSSVKTFNEEYKNLYTTESDLPIETIAYTSLDSYFSERINSEDDFLIDFVKIDIDGGEYHAFKGLDVLIKNNRIGTIIFEWNKMMLGNDLYLLLEFLNVISERQCTRIFIIN